MHFVDISILIVYLIVIFVISFRFYKKNISSDEYYLASRSLRWPTIGISLFASNISSTTIIGITSVSYIAGLAISNYEWLSFIPLFILAFIYIPILIKNKIVTMPSFLEKRYDKTTKIIFSVVTIIITLLVDVSGALYAGSILIREITLFDNVKLSVLLLGLLAGSYTIIGGFKTVVMTDVIQGILLSFACLILTLFLFSKFDYSIQNILLNMDNTDNLTLLRSNDDEVLPWSGTLIGIPILGFWYWVTNQYVVQRVLAAKNVNEAQLGCAFASILKLLPLFLIAFVGIMAFIINPSFDNPDKVFVNIALDLLPVGLIGLVMTGLLSAIFSSIDSSLNSSSTIIYHDFIRHSGFKIHPRIITLLLISVCILWAPFIEEFEGLWRYMQNLFSIVAPPVVAVFLYGVFSSKPSAHSANLTLILGFMFGIYLNFIDNLTDYHFTQNVGVTFVVSTIIFWTVTLFKINKKNIKKYIHNTKYNQGLSSKVKITFLLVVLFCISKILFFDIYLQRISN